MEICKIFQSITIDESDIIKHSQVFNGKEQYKFMSSFIKQVLIVLLSFSSALARVAKVSDQIKCVFQ